MINFSIIELKMRLTLVALSLLVFLPQNNFSQIKLEKDSVRSETSLPSGQDRNVFTLEQDQAFRRALDLSLPFSIRARLDLELSEPLWQIASLRGTEANPWKSAMNALNTLPEGTFEPNPVEVVQWQTNIMNSLYVPFMKTYSPYGAKLDFGTIGKFLGLVEDVSPVIKYNLAITADVEIVIYSVQATVIATLFKGVQSPGNYTINWNARDGQGRQMPPGDYIAEVRIASDRYVRKRIVLK